MSRTSTERQASGIRIEGSDRVSVEIQQHRAGDACSGEWDIAVHTYLYARPFTIISDQKPLETICAKPIHAAPSRLQRMLLQIHGCNIKVKYRPGKTMVLTDTLSRLPNPENNAEIELDVRVDGIDLVIDDPECKTIALINFPPTSDNYCETKQRKILY